MENIISLVSYYLELALHFVNPSPLVELTNDEVIYVAKLSVGVYAGIIAYFGVKGTPLFHDANIITRLVISIAFGAIAYYVAKDREFIQKLMLISIILAFIAIRVVDGLAFGFVVASLIRRSKTIFILLLLIIGVGVYFVSVNDYIDYIRYATIASITVMILSMLGIIILFQKRQLFKESPLESCVLLVLASIGLIVWPSVEQLKSFPVYAVFPACGVLGLFMEMRKGRRTNN